MNAEYDVQMYRSKKPFLRFHFPKIRHIYCFCTAKRGLDARLFLEAEIQALRFSTHFKQLCLVPLLSLRPVA